LRYNEVAVGGQLDVGVDERYLDGLRVGQCHDQHEARWSTVGWASVSQIPDPDFGTAEDQGTAPRMSRCVLSDVLEDVVGNHDLPA
jgi:hypothetical protein